MHKMYHENHPFLFLRKILVKTKNNFSKYRMIAKKLKIYNLKHPKLNFSCGGELIRMKYEI